MKVSKKMKAIIYSTSPIIIKFERTFKEKKKIEPTFLGSSQAI
jgi:hypothetical protein